MTSGVDHAGLQSPADDGLGGAEVLSKFRLSDAFVLEGLPDLLREIVHSMTITHICSSLTYMSVAVIILSPEKRGPLAKADRVI